MDDVVWETLVRAVNRRLDQDLVERMRRIATAPDVEPEASYEERA